MTEIITGTQADRGIDRTIATARSRARFKKWLESQPLIIVAYWGEAKRVNLRSMLRIWWESEVENGIHLGDVYPELEDDLQVKRVVSDVPVSEFKECPHVAAWWHGEDMNLAGLIEQHRRHDEAIELTEYIKQYAPNYRVRWNQTVLLMPGDPYGAFEVFGGDGTVHYRRRTADEVKQLCHVRRDRNAGGAA